MNKMRYFSIVIFFICYLSQVRYAEGTEHPGIFVNISQNGLQKLSDIIEFRGKAMLPTMKFPLPSYSMLDGFINITDIILGNATFSWLEMQLNQNEGIQLQLGNVSFSLNYDIYGFGDDIENGDALVQDTFITVIIGIGALNGRFDIQLARTDLSIGFISPGLDGKYIEWIENMTKQDISAVFADLLDFAIPLAMKDQLGDTFASLLNMSMQSYLDPENLTLIDYSVIGQPVITEELLQISMKADVRSTSMEHCSIPPPIFKEPLDEDFQIYISPTVPQCAINAFSESGVLNSIAQSYLQKYLPMDDRLKLEFNISSSSIATISPSGIIELFLDIKSYVIRNFGHVETYLTFDAHANTSLALNLSLGGQNGFLLSANISQVEAAVSVSQVADDMPDFYKQEISNTNFSGIDEILMERINEEIPLITQEINNRLVNVTREFAFAFAILGLKPTLNLSDKYIYMGINVTAL